MTTTLPPVIYWFRRDLRLSDLPGLAAAASLGHPVLPVFILDDQTPGQWAYGSASRWWLHHSLAALADAIQQQGGELLLLQGPARACLLQLAHQVGAAAIYCSRSYEPWARELEQGLHQDCESSAIEFKRYPGTLAFEPEQIKTLSGGPFKVFTPFWKACRREGPPHPVAASKVNWQSSSGIEAVKLAHLELLPVAPDWAAQWSELWQPGSAGAEQRLARFFAQGLSDYAEGRNHPAKQSTSMLSPHMQFGELSPRQLWASAEQARLQQPGLSDQVDKFLSELGWREFSHHLLFHYPHIAEKPFKPAFENFPWLGNRDHLQAWQTGQTGYPMVDAGMRELWHTGYMHNRVRMIVASFLTKHLLLPWQSGEAWFWDTLLDADLANNAAGWQWVAGSGADASPYFRIFNPTLQGQKFDSQGEYLRQWVPELAALPDRYLHEPATAPAAVLAEAAVELGTTYPLPIVEHRQARESALAAYASIRN
jgi:deoxyribodipyrimidine photo-lyase